MKELIIINLFGHEILSPMTTLTWMFLKHGAHESHMLKKDVHEEISYFDSVASQVRFLVFRISDLEISMRFHPSNCPCTT